MYKIAKLFKYTFQIKIESKLSQLNFTSEMNQYNFDLFDSMCKIR